MNAKVKDQTTILALLYALEKGYDIDIKIVSKNNIQLYVLAGNETQQQILDRGYEIQKEIGNQHDIDVKTTENDWRALNIYYTDVLGITDCKIVSMCSSPIRKMDDRSLAVLLDKKTGLMPETFINLFRKLYAKIVPVDCVKGTVTLKIDVFREAVEKLSSKVDSMYTGNKNTISKVSSNLFKIMFRPSEIRREKEKEMREREMYNIPEENPFLELLYDFDKV